MVKIWVWQGEKVLPNYGTGLVVVAAPTVDEAWAKLKREKPDVWFHLNYATSTMWDDNLDYAVSMLDEDDLREAAEKGYPVQPEGYDPADLPALAIWGSS